LAESIPVKNQKRRKNNIKIDSKKDNEKVIENNKAGNVG